MLKKIIKNLETGNYRIERREDCDCRFSWRLEKDELVCDIVSPGGDCWTDNVLIMDDLAGQRSDTLSVGNAGFIASYDVHFGLTPLLIKASIDAEQEIVKAIKNNYAYERLTDGVDAPAANNDLHDRRKREALVKWLSKNDHLRTYVYYPGDFANVYVCVLLTLPYYYDKKDYLQIPSHWLPKTADKLSRYAVTWAEMYLQKDTDGTQYDIDFRLVNQIYEINYCWYDRRANMTVSHETERYFFVDLQEAENFLDTLDPEGVDCYDLVKLTIDPDDGEIDDVDFQKTKWGPVAAKEARKNGNREAPEPEPEKEPETTPEMVFERYSKE